MFFVVFLVLVSWNFRGWKRVAVRTGVYWGKGIRGVDGFGNGSSYNRRRKELLL